MTNAFDRTIEAPQTGVSIDEYNTKERKYIRRISIKGSQSWGSDHGPMKSVVYLRGDEKEAAKKFVEANREQLVKFDLSGRNRLQEYLDREIYDWILHFLDYRKLKTFETVVRESRPDGTTWIIESERYENHNRRYTVSEGKVVKLSKITPREVFNSFGSIVTESGIKSHECVETKDPMVLLEYYRVSPDYDVEATTITRKTEMGIREESALQVQESKIDTDKMTSKEGNSENIEQHRYENEPDQRYFAIMFDTIGSIRIRVKKSDSYNIGYSIRPQLRFSRKKTERPIVEDFIAYCEENNITARLEERRDRESVICVISGIKNTRKLLASFRPHIIQQSEQVDIMLDEILPALESQKHTSKEGLIQIMESVEQLRETLDSTPNTRYDKAYFESEWNLSDSSKET